MIQNKYQKVSVVKKKITKSQQLIVEILQLHAVNRAKSLPSSERV